MFNRPICLAEATADAPTGAGASPPAPAPTAALPAPQAAPGVADGEPDFLRNRLERERKATLKKLGIKVGKNDDITAKIAEAAADRETKKAERRALKDEVASLKGQHAATAGTTAALKVFAEAELSGLDEKQRAAIKTVAGDDPAKTLETIALFKLSGYAPVTTATALPAPPAPAPANTTPAGGAPPPPTNTSGEDVKATYAQLKQTNPFAAAQFALMHERELLGG